MKSVELGRTGVQVSQLSLGCMIMGTSTDEPTAVRMLDHYREAGGNFLDTANCYCWWHREGSLGGESEELLGRWLQRTGRREDVFLATKGSGMVWDQDGVWRDGVADWSVARQRFEGAGAQTLTQGDRRQPAPPAHRLDRPVLRPRRRPGDAAGGDAGGAGRHRGRRQGPLHRVVQRADLAAGADPSALRPARLAGSGRAPAAALLPAPAGRPRAWLHRGR